MIRAGKIETVLNRADLDRLLASQSGPVARHLLRVGARVEGEAKRNASGRVLSNGTTLEVRSGRTRASISHRLFVQNGQLGVAIGVGPHYSTYTMLGTRHIVGRPVLQDAARAVLGPSVI